MTERLYTETDLRTEAVRQHAELAEDPDFVGIGESMESQAVPSTRPSATAGNRWGDLPLAVFDEARASIHDQITGAANCSQWAVNLGADGLTPSTEHEITISNGDRQLARIHFAFEPGTAEHVRTALVQRVNNALADAL